MRRTAIDVAATVLLYLAIQALVIVAHEHVHSTMAWALGETRTPFTVIWGNPVTVQGCDEGVPYDALFHGDGHPAEAAIGGMPLLMHAVLVVVGLAALRRPVGRRWVFVAWLWVVAVDLGELVAYILMRPFIATGDTGRFNHGLAISPWFLCGGGTVFIAAALWVLGRRVVPTLAAVAGGSRAGLVLAVGTGFVVFLWMSGLRMLALHPDPQWRTGLIGVAGFALWLAATWRLASRRAAAQHS